MSSARHSTASAPWATWGSMTSVLEHVHRLRGEAQPVERGHGHDDGAAFGGTRDKPGGDVAP